MAINVKSHITGKEKGTKWKTLTDRFYENHTLTLSDTDIRKEIERDQRGLLTNLDGFLTELYDVGATTVTLDVHESSAQRADLTKASGGLLIQEGVRAKYAHVQKAVKALTEDNALDGNWNVDHADIAPVNTRVTALIESLEMLKEELSTSTETGRGSDIGNKLYSMGASTANQDSAIRDITNRIQHLKKARAYLKELEQVIRSGKSPSEEDLAAIVKANATGSTYDITTEKINDVNVYEEGGDIGSFQIIEKGVHTQKTAYQSNMGFVLNKIMTGKYNIGSMMDPQQKQNIEEMYRQITTDPTTIVGSEGIKNSIERQIHDVFKGKKPKPSKSKTTRTKRVKEQMDLRKTKAALAKIKAKKRRAKQALLLASKAETSKKRIRSSSSDQAKAALHLKRLINRRLPAEVRRNMGRPALINRTGRFSNSVKLESLVPSKAGFVGKYSYMYRPYETFENTGVYSWPAGYNPKPLITKSIRNLAVQHMETKLTLRRT